MHQKLQDLLHEYKKAVFRVEHDRKSVDDITTECVQIADEVLEQKYHYHFHRLPDANRAEIINMISNYTREAILPPVVSNLVRRQVMLERRMEALSELIEKTLVELSNTPANAVD